MVLPRVASNKETRYETYVQAQTNSGNKYVRFHVLSIATSGFSSPSVLRLCGESARI